MLYRRTNKKIFSSSWAIVVLVALLGITFWTSDLANPLFSSRMLKASIETDKYPQKAFSVKSNTYTDSSSGLKSNTETKDRDSSGDGEFPITRIFVIGCGHSGTSLLFRSIGNLRHVRCLEKESALFVKNTEGDERLRSMMEEWDALARKGNYSFWVEKTPRHVYYIDKMVQLERYPKGTKVVFIHRDGRDVAISFRARGYSWEKSVNRWVDDNMAALPFLDSGQALAVSFEKLTSSATVLQTMRDVAKYIGIEATDAELAMALLPGTHQHAYQEYCTAYENDVEKFADLSASLVQLLSGRSSGLDEDNMKASMDRHDGKDDEPRNVEGGVERKGIEVVLQSKNSSRLERHNAFRTWQMSQAWTEIIPTSDRDWSEDEERYFMGREDVQELMRRFGYSY